MRSLRQAPVCEKYFGVFLILWGLCLYSSYFFHLPQSLFQGALEAHAPSWIWGTGMIILGTLRLTAYFWCSNNLRLGLSTTTAVLFSVLACISLYQLLIAVTFPLCTFIAAWSYWCHGCLAKELAIGERNLVAAILDLNLDKSRTLDKLCAEDQSECESPPK